MKKFMNTMKEATKPRNLATAAKDQKKYIVGYYAYTTAVSAIVILATALVNTIYEEKGE